MNRLTARAFCCSVHHAARQTSTACDTAPIDGIDPVLHMNDIPVCPQCGSTLCYQDRGLFACPECAHEWTGNDAAENTIHARIVTDAIGNRLAEGDNVSVIKDLKVKGTSAVVKVGTRVRNIRLVEGDHDIDCKIAGSAR